MQDAHRNKATLVLVPGGNMKKEKQLRRDDGITVPLDEDEKTLVQTLAFPSGKKTATFARSLFYRGIAAYLKDRRENEADVSEEQLYDRLRKFVQGNKELEVVYKMIRAHGQKQTTGKTATR